MVVPWVCSLVVGCWVVVAVDGSGRDFFISYVGVNRSWAEWIAVVLEGAGYSTVVQSFDFRPGVDFVHEMQVAASSAGRTIAVLSPAYFGSRFGEAEWRAAFVKDPTGELGLLLPVRVEPCRPPGLLASRGYVDLVGVDETGARRKLLAAVDRGRPRPTTAPWPGGDGAVDFPGSGPGGAVRGEAAGRVRPGDNGDGRAGRGRLVVTPLLAPPADPWTLAVHDAEKGFAPIGTAVAVAPRLAVTCAHVVLRDFDRPGSRGPVAPLWVSFPKVPSAWKERRLVTRVEYEADDPQIADVAVLHLAEDMPAVVEPPRLKLLEPDVLAGYEHRHGLHWWAFGFPVSSRRNGSEATGTVGAPLAHGWVRLHTESPYPVEKGFSGGGLWVPEYSAVAGIVGQAMPAGNHRGDAQALTLAQAARFLPGAKLQVFAGWAAADAGATAMAAWGLAADPEAGRHWRPRGRGVMTDLDRGYRFQGRTAALTQIVEWLDRPVTDRRVLVVTGSPGVGKSAVLGRVVTTADQRLRAELPASDAGVVASIGSVACAVHVKGKTALDVATEIASAAGAVLPERVEDLAGVVHAVLAGRPRRFNILIDAVDEAASAADARAVLAGIVLPLTQICGDEGVQVVCGSRRHDAEGHLLGSLAVAAVEIDLDEPEYFELADLQAYTLATLQLVGSERLGNPYTDPAVAEPAAARIAKLAEPNFLVAGLDARARGMYDTIAADPATLTLIATVDAALDAYLARVPPVDGISVRAVLTALAYAEAPGWSSEVWRAATVALGTPAGDVHLDRFSRTAAASFLIESSTTTGASVFRLFHQALNDALLRDRSPGGVRADEQRLTRAMHALGRDRTWADAPPYLLRSLSGHADRAGIIDELLADDTYLLYADLLRLLPAANRARTEIGRSRARLLNLSPQAVAAPPPERAAMFSITRALENLTPMTADVADPYHARWAHARQRAELRRFDGHSGEVVAVCPISVNGDIRLATGGSDGTVRIWDPGTGIQHHQLDGHTDWVRAMCPITVDGQTLLFTAGDDRTVRTWDMTTGTQHHQLAGNADWTWAMCPITVDGRALLATAGDDGTVWIWDPASGTQLTRLDGHTNGARAACPITVDGQNLLATAGDDGTVRIWDPSAGTQLHQLDGHTAGVNAICQIIMGGQTLLASAGDDGTVLVWDPATGTQLRRLDGHTGVARALCPITVDGLAFLATVGDDGTVRIWAPGTGMQQRQLNRRASRMNAVCPITVDGQALIATAGEDGRVRIWDPAADNRHRELDRATTSVNAVCPVTVDGREVLATGSDDGTILVWDPATGTQHRRLRGHTSHVNAVCPITVGGQALLASGGDDETVRIWDPATGNQLRRLDGHTGQVRAVCQVTVDGQALLASGGSDGPVRIWDPATGAQHLQLHGYPGGVWAACQVVIDGQAFLVTGNDGPARIWDLATGTQHRRLDGHIGGVRAVCQIIVDGRALLATGGRDGTVRIWDLATGNQLRRLDGHTGAAWAVCEIVIDGQAFLATAGNDETVRIWDPDSGRCLWTVPVHHPAIACGAVHGSLIVALAAGLIAIDFRLDGHQQRSGQAVT